MSCTWRHRAVLAAITLVALPAAAEPASITFARAIGLVDELPVLASQRTAAARERASRVASAWQPLLVRAVPALRLAPGVERGAEGSIAAEQPLVLADVAGRRRATQDAIADAHAATAIAAALDARLDVAASWIRGWQARERLAAADRDRDLARSLVAASERARTAGALTAAELADALAFLAEAELAFLDAEGALADASFATARSLVRPGALASEGELPSPPLPTPETWDSLVDAVRTSPAAHAQRLVARASRTRAAEERAARAPQLVMGASIDRDGPGALVAGVTLGVVLPHDRGEREARSAETAALIAEAGAETLAVRAAVELRAALHEVEHTGAVVAEITGRLVPAAEDAAERRARAFDVGEATITELLAARRVANAARARVGDARAAHAWARIRAAYLIEATGGAR